MREFFTIAIFKIKADIRMNKTALNSQKEKHSMLSLRRATFVGLAAHRLRNISIHALLAESDADNGDAGNGCDAISIHALLAESDGMTEFIGALFDISIHALLAESDLPVFLSGFWAYLFLSTLSLRRATYMCPIISTIILIFLSTLSLRRATGTLRTVSVRNTFLSTLSLRRATHH